VDRGVEPKADLVMDPQTVFMAAVGLAVVVIVVPTRENVAWWRSGRRR